MSAKICMWTSIMIFAVSLVMSIISFFFEGYVRLWLASTSLMMAVPGWIFNIIGWIKLIRE